MTKTDCVLLVTCLELFISAPNTTTFLPFPPSGCLKIPVESNPTP